MTKWNAIKIPLVINGSERRVLLWHRGKKSLTALFTALCEKREPPYNITELSAIMRHHHPFFSKSYFRDDLAELSLCGVVELRGAWREKLIVPLFKEARLVPYEDTVKIIITTN